MHFVTKHFTASSQAALEDLMNAFLATLPMSAVADVSVSQLQIGTGVKYYGLVIYQE